MTELCDIELWLAFDDEISDAALHARYQGLLNAGEREQQMRFHFAHDRLRFLITRALIRTVLSRHLPLAPEDWLFAQNPYGRPHIANSKFANSRLRFNVSHTRGLIALAITSGREIGIDVENTRVRPVSCGIAERFFAPSEVSALACLPPERQQDRFFEYWTLKESYIKARGMGLSISLDKFSFHYPHEDSVQIAIDDELDDDPRRWQFWQLRPTPDHLLAVCGERISTEGPRLVVRKVVPTVSESELAVTPLRASH